MDTLFFRLLLTISVGAVGSFVLYKLRLPAGALIGAAIAVSLLNIFAGAGWFPPEAKVGVQAIAGAFVGQRIGRDDITELKSLVKPALIIFLGICILSLCSGFFIYGTSDNIDITTALLSSTPGGVTDIVLIATDVGADPAQSAALQLTRYMVAILILPQINTWLCRRFCPASQLAEQPAASPRSRTVGKKNAAVKTLLIAHAAGLIGKISHIPAGTIVFSMLAVAIYNIRIGSAYIPRPFKLVAQSMAGISIGTAVSMADILGLKELIVPAVIIILNCLLINYGLGFLMYRISGLDMATCLFASVPAGVSDMALISLEQGGDAPKVAILQMTRYICVMAFMPSLIKLIAALM